jgi:hypothetical protein
VTYSLIEYHWRMVLVRGTAHSLTRVDSIDIEHHLASPHDIRRLQISITDERMKCDKDMEPNMLTQDDLDEKPWFVFDKKTDDLDS